MRNRVCILQMGSVLSDWHMTEGMHSSVSKTLKKALYIPSFLFDIKVFDRMYYLQTKCGESGVCMLPVTSNHAFATMKTYWSRAPTDKTNTPLEQVNTDIAGPVTMTQFQLFTFVYFLKANSDVVQATGTFLADVVPYGKMHQIR